MYEARRVDVHERSSHVAAGGPCCWAPTLQLQRLPARAWRNAVAYDTVVLVVKSCKAAAGHRRTLDTL